MTRSRCSPAPTTASSTRCSSVPREWTVSCAPCRSRRASRRTWSRTSSSSTTEALSRSTILKARGAELAAVLVEPVQSRRPELQPVEFLRDVRADHRADGHGPRLRRGRLGFPCSPGRRPGAVRHPSRPRNLRQGRRRRASDRPGRGSTESTWTPSMEAQWSYGDDRFPEVGVTFFAGTFVRHPLALAAARAVFAAALGRRARPAARPQHADELSFVERLNAHAEAVGAPVRITHFSSWLCFNFPTDVPHASLFYAYMRDNGVHVWEGRAGSSQPRTRTTTSHMSSLRSGRRSPRCKPPTFLPGDAAPPVPGARRGRDAEGRDAWFVPDPGRPGKYLQVEEAAAAVADGEPRLAACRLRPLRAAGGSRGDVSRSLTEPQAEMWTAAAMGREANCSYNQCFALTFDGPLRVESLRAALDQVVARHDGLARRHRAGRRRPDAPAAVLCRHAAPRPVGARSRGATSVRSRASSSASARRLRPRRGPARSRLRRARVRRRPPSSSSRCITLSATAGRRPSSSRTSACCTQPIASVSRLSSPPQRRTASTSPSRPSARPSVTAAAADEDYWAAQYPTGAPVLDLPLPGARPATKTYAQRPRALGDRRRAVRCAQADRGEIRSHAVRDPAGCVRGARVPLLRPVGLRRRAFRSPSSRCSRTRTSSPIASTPCRCEPASTRRPRSPITYGPSVIASPRPRSTRASRSAAWCAGCAFPETAVARRSWRSRSASTRSAHRSTSAT